MIAAPADAVVFDLDDTLYLERDFVFSGYRAVSAVVEAELGFAIEERLIARFLAGERGDLFTPTLKERLRSVDEPYIRHLVAVYRQHEPDIRPFPDTLPTLDALAGRISLGLITDGIPAVQRNKLRALGLESRFDAIVVTGELGPDAGKPSPRPYRECARLLGRGDVPLTYVGDNPAKDFVGAHSLGWDTIRVHHPDSVYAAHAHPPPYAARRTVSRLQEILQMLIRW